MTLKQSYKRECQRPSCLSGAFEKTGITTVSIRVKGKMYRVIILSTLLYGAETWTVYRRHVKRLHAFMSRHNVVNHEDQRAGQSD